MGWLKRRGGEDLRLEDRALTRETVPAVMLADPLGEFRTSPRSTLALADVHAAVSAIVSTCSTLPLEPFTLLGDERAPFRGRVADLLRAPAPGLTPAGFLGALFSQLVLTGDAFTACYRNGDGEIHQLASCPPSGWRSSPAAAFRSTA